MLRTLKNFLTIPGRWVGAKVVRSDSIHFGRKVAPYGVDLFLDLERLGAAKPFSTILDVGANVGRWSVAVSGRFPAAQIHAFEPVPETFAKLQQNVAPCNVQPHCLALGIEAKTQTIDLYESHEMNSLGTTPRDAELAGNKVGSAEITIRLLDSVFPELGTNEIDLLKTDAEGHDLEVLQGAESLLGAGKIRFVYSEWYYVSQPNTTAGTLVGLWEYLSKFGFGYVASYTDYLLPERQLHGVHNALFMKLAREGL